MFEISTKETILHQLIGKDAADEFIDNVSTRIEKDDTDAVMSAIITQYTERILTNSEDLSLARVKELVPQSSDHVDGIVKLIIQQCAADIRGAIINKKVDNPVFKRRS